MASAMVQLDRALLSLEDVCSTHSTFLAESFDAYSSLSVEDWGLILLTTFVGCTTVRM